MSPAYVLAKAVLAAAEALENSYDHEAAKAFHEKHGKDALVDYTRFYRLSLEEACDLQGELSRPVELMLQSWWNDSIDWAKEIVAAVDGPREGGG